MIFPGRFEGKVLVVTGAAQGLGEAVATRAAQEGGAVALVDRSRLVHEVSREAGRRGRADDLADRESRAIHGLRDDHGQGPNRFGRIDILINNVGGTIELQAVCRVHRGRRSRRRSAGRCFPTMWCCRAVLPSMVEQGRGTIVNVSSAAARGINRIPYAAAKGGVNALTASLALGVRRPRDTGRRHRSRRDRGPAATNLPRHPAAEQTEQEKAWYQAHIDQTSTPR